MGFKTLRQYITSLTDYDQVIETICLNRDKVRITSDPGHEKGDKGNFTFYINKYPEVRIQITSKRFFLKLFGVKHNGFDRDLEVISELTSLLATLHPEGISFKFDKSSLGSKDKDEAIRQLEGQRKMFMEFTRKALSSPQKFRDYKNEIWKNIKNDSEARRYCAELAKNYFAQAVCMNGFRCTPDGSIEPKNMKLTIADIFASAVLDDLGIELQ